MKWNDEGGRKGEHRHCDDKMTEKERKMNGRHQRIKRQTNQNKKRRKKEKQMLDKAMRQIRKS